MGSVKMGRPVSQHRPPPPPGVGPDVGGPEVAEQGDELRALGGTVVVTAIATDAVGGEEGAEGTVGVVLCRKGKKKHISHICGMGFARCAPCPCLCLSRCFGTNYCTQCAMSAQNMLGRELSASYPRLLSLSLWSPRYTRLYRYRLAATRTYRRRRAASECNPSHSKIHLHAASTHLKERTNNMIKLRASKQAIRAGRANR